MHFFILSRTSLVACSTIFSPVMNKNGNCCFHLLNLKHFLRFVNVLSKNHFTDFQFNTRFHVFDKNNEEQISYGPLWRPKLVNVSPHRQCSPLLFYTHLFVALKNAQKFAICIIVGHCTGGRGQRHAFNSELVE